MSGSGAGDKSVVTDGTPTEGTKDDRGGIARDRRTEVKLSARNILKGKVKSVNPGAVNSEVIVELPGGQEVVSIITKSSAENLKLAPGTDVYAVIKATSVMIATD